MSTETYKYTGKVPQRRHMACFGAVIRRRFGADRTQKPLTTTKLGERKHTHKRLSERTK